MTTTAAENLAGPWEREGGEAAGSGARAGVVAAGAAGCESVRAAAPPAAGADAGTRAGAPAPHIPGGPGAAGGQQVPPLPFSQGRNDKALTNVATADQAQGEAVPGVIRAVAQEAVDVTAELRSAGLRSAQPGAAVPTFTAQEFPDTGTGDAGWRTGVSAPHEESITIHAQAESRMPGNLVINLAIADIDKNPFQTRYVHDDDKLEELADSIKANGVVQPIVVRPRRTGMGATSWFWVSGGCTLRRRRKGYDSGDRAAGFAAAGGGDDDRREPAAR